MSIPFDLWGQRGWGRVDVAGESYHSKGIRAIVGADIKPGGVEINVDAQLVPEPANKHDPKAVGVWCGRHQLGYLPREEAARYVTVLSQLVAQGWLPQVNARVWASEWSYDDEPGRREFTASVRLDLAEPHMLVPANMPPSGEHQTLPFGSAIQVTGEEKHLDALASLLRPEGECWAYATLHEIVEQTTRTPKPLVEVRVNEARVGQLTPKMSGELLPAVRHLADRGAVTAARAIVKGNRIKAEVVLHVVRAHELPASWLGEAQEASSDASSVSAAPREHAPIPPPPTSIRFVVPPGWPAPPTGWAPPPGWRPDPGWPPAPGDWQWWVPTWD